MISPLRGEPGQGSEFMPRHVPSISDLSLESIQHHFDPFSPMTSLEMLQNFYLKWVSKAKFPDVNKELPFVPTIFPPDDAISIPELLPICQWLKTVVDNGNAVPDDLTRFELNSMYLLISSLLLWTHYQKSDVNVLTRDVLVKNSSIQKVLELLNSIKDEDLSVSHKLFTPPSWEEAWDPPNSPTKSNSEAPSPSYFVKESKPDGNRFITALINSHTSLMSKAVAIGRIPFANEVVAKFQLVLFHQAYVIYHRLIKFQNGDTDSLTFESMCEKYKAVAAYRLAELVQLDHYSILPIGVDLKMLLSTLRDDLRISARLALGVYGSAKVGGLMDSLRNERINFHCVDLNDFPNGVLLVFQTSQQCELTHGIEACSRFDRKSTGSGNDTSSKNSSARSTPHRRFLRTKVFVIFRGSNGLSFDDWKLNMMSLPREGRIKYKGVTLLKTWMHMGFYARAKRLVPLILEEIEKFLEQQHRSTLDNEDTCRLPRKLSFFICGHSQGAALATILAHCVDRYFRAEVDVKVSIQRLRHRVDVVSRNLQEGIARVLQKQNPNGWNSTKTNCSNQTVADLLQNFQSSIHNKIDKWEKKVRAALKDVETDMIRWNAGGGLSEFSHLALHSILDERTPKCHSVKESLVTNNCLYIWENLLPPAALVHLRNFSMIMQDATPEESHGATHQLDSFYEQMCQKHDSLPPFLLRHIQDVAALPPTFHEQQLNESLGSMLANLRNKFFRVLSFGNKKKPPEYVSKVNELWLKMEDILKVYHSKITSINTATRRYFKAMIHNLRQELPIDGITADLKNKLDIDFRAAVINWQAVFPVLCEPVYLTTFANPGAFWKLKNDDPLFQTSLVRHTTFRVDCDLIPRLGQRLGFVHGAEHENRFLYSRLFHNSSFWDRLVRSHFPLVYQAFVLEISANGGMGGHFDSATANEVFEVMTVPLSRYFFSSLTVWSFVGLVFAVLIILVLLPFYLLFVFGYLTYRFVVLPALRNVSVVVCENNCTRLCSNIRFCVRNDVVDVIDSDDNNDTAVEIRIVSQNCSASERDLGVNELAMREDNHHDDVAMEILIGSQNSVSERDVEANESTMTDDRNVHFDL